MQTETFLERVRENTGLQNVGLLALDNANGSVKRDTWTSSFRDIISALDYPQQVGEPPVISQPDVLPGGQVHFPDSNLRAAVAEALGKSANAPITLEEMGTLRGFEAENRDIHDLTGLQFATNLTELFLRDNQISDLSPLTGLIKLRVLLLDRNPISDLSALKGIKNLSRLEFGWTEVFDLSPIAGLLSLKRLQFHDTGVTDLSPIAGLVNLEFLWFAGDKTISDLSPIAGLTNLIFLFSWGNHVSDLAPLARLTKLEHLDICGAKLSDLTPLADLTALKNLYLGGNGIPDISSLTGLTGLNRLNLTGNNISDISPLGGLTNLTWLNVSRNEISDFSPLDRLRENTNIEWYDNPGFPIGGPKIEGPWLWVVLPDANLESGTDLLAEASGGRVTEAKIAIQGATIGEPVGDDVWTFHKLPAEGGENLQHLLGDRIGDAVVYGTVSLYSPREQGTIMYIGGDEGVKVWLNGALIHQHGRSDRLSDNYTDLSPVTLKQGKNVLLVALHSEGNGFFGFEPGTEYSVETVIGYAFSEAPIHIGDTFTLDIRADNVSDLAGWQFDIAFDHAALEAINVSEGEFLKADGGSTFFQGGRIDNANGKITGLSTALLGNRGVSGSGAILQVKLKAKSEGETRVVLQNFKFGSFSGENISAGPLEVTLTVEERLPTGDVNRDGGVDILDLILVARQLGQSVPANSAVDINGDGVVNIFDLTLVAQGIGGAAAPPVATGRVDTATIEAWIAEARLADDGSVAFRQGIANLQNLLTSLTIPGETALLANYPNPFNPETWIPYQLAVPAEVTLAIYDMNGGAVRRLEVGHQPAGTYKSRERAAYWDGRNGRGESVASGLYFYTLKAGEFRATRKMLIRK